MVTTAPNRRARQAMAPRAVPPRARVSPAMRAVRICRAAHLPRALSPPTRAHALMARAWPCLFARWLPYLRFVFFLAPRSLAALRCSGLFGRITPRERPHRRAIDRFDDQVSSVCDSRAVDRPNAIS